MKTAIVIPRKRILVVDDDPGVREALKRHLKSAGYHVDLATDGIEAVATFSQKGADLVILDVNMPRKNGFQAGAGIKKIRNVPVIFLSGGLEGMQSNEVVRIADSLGSEVFLYKPTDIELLLQIVRKLLGKTVASARAEIAS